MNGPTIPHLYMPQRAIEKIAAEYNMSIDDVKQICMVRSYETSDERNKRIQIEEITNRINRRLRGEYVSPAWIASFRR